MKASRFIKGDYRKHAPLKAKPSQNRIVEYAPETNRHERRRVKSLSRTYGPAILKGVPGAARFRDMVRKNGLQETIMLMHGYNRGVKRHPGYPTMGNYDKTGGYLASPRKAK